MDAELRELFTHLRYWVEVHRQIGLDPPPVKLGTVGRKREKGPCESLGSLTELARQVSNCERCKLHRGRTQVVFGEGSPTADLMFVGEAPGRDEDLSGRPFVGRAGQLLTRMIEAMGFKRSDVFIGNVLKCRPPGNRTPAADEIASCLTYLKKQIERSIRPSSWLSVVRLRKPLSDPRRASRLSGAGSTGAGSTKGFASFPRSIPLTS